MDNDLRESFRTLEVSPGASAAEVAQAHRDLVHVWSPDRFAHDPALAEKAQRKLTQINAAFEAITRAALPPAQVPPPSAPPPAPVKAAPPAKVEVRPAPKRSLSAIKPARAGTPTPSLASPRRWRLPLLLGLASLPAFAAVWWVHQNPEVIARVVSGQSEPAPAIKPTGRHHLSLAQIDLLYREAQKADPKLNMTLPEFSRFVQPGMPAYDLSEGMRTAAPRSGARRPSNKELARRESGRPPGAGRPHGDRLPRSVRPGQFTVGSTKDEVVAAQGTPDEFNNNVFVYPNGAKVFFRDDRVLSWKMTPANPLNVDLIAPPASEEKESFTIGSTKEEVLAVQGMPDQLGDNVFVYPYGSKVFFDDGRVVAWKMNPKNHLRAEWLPDTPVANLDSFTLGSTRDEVLAVQGTPDECSDSAFNYAGALVYLRDGHVTAWKMSPASPLKVELKPSGPVAALESFTVGSTKDEVLAVQGTPDEVTDTAYTYSFGSKVFFSEGRVVAWRMAPENPLKAELQPATSVWNREYFTVGSTKDEVLAVQGTPDEITDTVFDYSFGSKVYFQDGHVTSWKMSPTNPLRARLQR